MRNFKRASQITRISSTLCARTIRPRIAMKNQPRGGSSRLSISRTPPKRARELTAGFSLFLSLFSISGGRASHPARIIEDSPQTGRADRTSDSPEERKWQRFPKETGARGSRKGEEEKAERSAAPLRKKAANSAKQRSPESASLEILNSVRRDNAFPRIRSMHHRGAV